MYDMTGVLTQERIALKKEFGMFKVNCRNTKTKCEICSKLTIKTPEQLHCLYC